MLHASEHTQPPIQEVMGVIFSGIEGPHLKLAADLHLVTKFRRHGDCLHSSGYLHGMVLKHSILSLYDM